MMTLLPDGLRSPLLKAAVRLRLLPGESVRDLRHRIEETGVRTSLFVCTTPRSGSNLLDGLLASTGLVGEPAEDFGPVFETQVLPTLGRAGIGQYLLGCVSRAVGGVYSMKLHGFQRDRFLHLLSLLRGAHGFRDGELIAAVFPRPRYVWLRRQDVVAQAVSWWKATESGVWIGAQGSGAEFDFDGIDEGVQKMREENDAWRRWFSSAGIEPLEVLYEQLDADAGPVVRDVLSFVGIDPPRDLTVTPRNARQSDAVNAEWIRRYRELAPDVEGI